MADSLVHATPTHRSDLVTHFVLVSAMSAACVCGITCMVVMVKGRKEGCGVEEEVVVVVVDGESE